MARSDTVPGLGGGSVGCRLGAPDLGPWGGRQPAGLRRHLRGGVERRGPAAGDASAGPPGAGGAGVWPGGDGWGRVVVLGGGVSTPPVLNGHPGNPVGFRPHPGRPILFFHESRFVPEILCCGCGDPLPARPFCLTLRRIEFFDYITIFRIQNWASTVEHA